MGAEEALYKFAEADSKLFPVVGQEAASREEVLAVREGILKDLFGNEMLEQESMERGSRSCRVRLLLARGSSSCLPQSWSPRTRPPSPRVAI